MTLVQESLIVTNLDINIQDVTSFLSPDSLIIFINVLMANITAIVTLIAAIAPPAPSTSTPTVSSDGLPQRVDNTMSPNSSDVAIKPDLAGAYSV